MSFNQTATVVPLTREAAAEARVAVALEAIQEAQRLVEQAAQGLCSVSGMGREWRRLGALHGQMKRAWYDVQGKSDSLSLKGRLVLDHEPDHHEEHWRALRRGR